MKHLLSLYESIVFWKQIYQEELSEKEKITWESFKANNRDLDEYTILDNELRMHHEFKQKQQKACEEFLERFRKLNNQNTQ